MTTIPPPPPQQQTTDQTATMSATYIPQGNTFNEFGGVPGYVDETSASFISTAQASQQRGDSTPQDAYPCPNQLYAGAIQQRGLSVASNATSQIPPDIIAAWPLESVLSWLTQHQFSDAWKATFKRLNLQGARFLELGSARVGRGNFGMMHQEVYPTLAEECAKSGIEWNQAQEREEGKRMRRLIRSIVTGRPVDPSKVVPSHQRTNSSAQNGSSGDHGKTDATDSPNVGLILPNMIS